MYRRQTDAHTPQLRRAQARYELARSGLTALLVALVLCTLGLLVWQNFTIRANQAQIRGLVEQQRQQGLQVKAVLDRQTAADSSRQDVVNRAVAAIAAEQRRALVAHDRRVAELLQRHGVLIGKVAARPVAARTAAVVRPLPRPTGRVAASGPVVGPPTAPPRVAPRPAPQPAPQPCTPRGKSGKCHK